MTKEELELIEAVSHGRGTAMTPVEELSLLGFYEINVSESKTEASIPEKECYIREHYDFDENDRRYKELAGVLRMNNDRRKYFA